MVFLGASGSRLYDRLKRRRNAPNLKTEGPLLGYRRAVRLAAVGHGAAQLSGFEALSHFTFAHRHPEGHDGSFPGSMRHGGSLTMDGKPTNCQACGACCAFSHDWPRFTLEADADLDFIPEQLVNAAGSGMRCVGNRCSALIGEVGRSTSCSIYGLRPDVCRACEPGDDACRMARHHFQLDEEDGHAPA
jgi:uncharacterized protein